ncbi:unnamed protein product, partial [Rhizoctonia solani]
RCLKGGYECLGYEDSDSRAKVHQRDPDAPVASQVPPISTSDPARLARSETLDTVLEATQTVDLDAGELGPSILKAALLYRMSRTTPSTTNNCIVTDSSEDFNCSWPQDQIQSTIYSRSPIRPCFGTNSGVRPVSNDLSRVIEALCQSIPPIVDAREMMRKDHFENIIHEYNLMRACYWLMIPSPAIIDSLTAQLRGSKRIIWTMYWGAKLFQALAQNPQTCGSAVQVCIGWINKLEHNFTVDSHRNPPLTDVADCLKVQLELAHLNFAVVDSVLGYNLLQKALPRFLQIVAVDSNLYMELPNGSLAVSFPRALSASRYEIRRFAIFDAAVALVLGVPPLVEYGYDGECDPESHGLEWIHGIPVALLEVIAQVTSWRAGSKVPLDDWEALERRVLAWKPAIPATVPTLETASVPRAAVQESWRHVALIYIYMGLCGVASDDSRVQESVHRMAQLGATVADIPISIHMLMSCVVAGLAARLEKHRVLVYNMLLSFKGAQVWLFQGPQLGQVLYHLWHGVGAGGASVTWDDYVQS